MSTPVPGVLSRRSHRRCARIRCAPPVARNATHSSHGAQEAHLHAEHDAPDHGHGRDQAVPGPADSLEGRQGGRPGKHFPQLTGAEQNASYTCLSNVFEGRSAMLSLSAAEYRRSLRRQGIRQLAAAAAKAAPAAATAAPAAPPSAPSRAQPAARQPASGATAGVNGRRCRACCKAAQVGANGWARPLAAGTAT